MNSWDNNFSKHQASQSKKFTRETKIHLAEILAECEWGSLVNWYVKSHKYAGSLGNDYETKLIKSKRLIKYTSIITVLSVFLEIFFKRLCMFEVFI